MMMSMMIDDDGGGDDDDDSYVIPNTRKEQAEKLKSLPFYWSVMW